MDDLRPAERRRLQALAVPFLNDAPMIGPPSCTIKDFETPRLRRCTLNPNTLVLEARLGGGLDGYVWKAWFGDSGPFALKVFWDVRPPDFRHYYAPQRECQNAAVLQMMQAAVASGPILVYDSPETKEDAIANFYAFADESRQAQQSKGIPEITIGTRLISSTPRIVQCYGWLKLSGSLFQDIPTRLRAPPTKVDKIQRSIASDKEYIALIYELVEGGENVPAIVKNVVDFLWHTGFSFTLSPLAKNWKRGVLLDQSDIIHVSGFGWKEQLYGTRQAGQILVD